MDGTHNLIGLIIKVLNKEKRSIVDMVTFWKQSAVFLTDHVRLCTSQTPRNYGEFHTPTAPLS